jgi:hypothetical protein
LAFRKRQIKGLRRNFFDGRRVYSEFDLEPFERCEEAGDLLTREKWRRLERRDMGLERRWE